MSAPSSTGGKVARFALNAYAGFALLYLFVPIIWIVAFSFNKPLGNYNVEWQSFTLDNWADPFADEALTNAFVESLKIAAISTVIATILGSLIAIALARYRFRGSGPLNFLLVLPLTTPEIVLGSSLATLFLDWDITRGFTTVVIAHIMFQVSFVALTVRARVRGFDWTLEQAAQDLGASPLRTFWKVTFPLDPARNPGGGVAVVRTVARRLHHHAVQRRFAGDVPAVHQRQFPGEVPARGQRARHSDPDRERRTDARRHLVGRPRASQVCFVTAQRTQYVFVYGTLRPGDVRWHFLAPFVIDEGWADTVPGQLFDTGLDYPAAVFNDQGMIHGHSFALIDESFDRALEVLDEVEGIVDGEYSRVVVRTARGIDAWAYASGDGLDLTLIDSGDWHLHRPITSGVRPQA